VPVLLQVIEKKAGLPCVLTSYKVAQADLWVYVGISEKKMYLTDCGLFLGSYSFHMQ